MFKTESAWLPMISLSMASFLWASSFVALKLAFVSYSPMVVIFVRMVVASLFFLFFIKKIRTVKVARSDIKMILVLSFCEPCLYFVFEAMAMENTTASQAGMMVAMLPLLVAVAAGFLLKERVSVRTMAGFALAIFGACWLSLGGEPGDGAPNPLLGNFYEFLAMCCAAGYTIAIKRLKGSYPPFFLAGIQSFVGALFFMGFLFLPQTTLPTTFEPVAAFSVLYLGIFVSLGAYGCYNFGVSRIPASQAVAFTNLIPVFCVLMAVLILGERLGPIQYIASALVILGVFISQERKEMRPAASPTG